MIEEQENYDFDAEATYVTTSESDVEYLQDPNVSAGTDFDLPQVLPSHTAESMTDIEYEDLEPADYDSTEDDEYEYVDEEDSIAAKTGVVQDFVDLSKGIASGNPDDAASAIEEFSASQIDRFSSPKLIGPILLYWAFKGKLTKVERAIAGLVGAGALIRGYGVRSKVKTVQTFAHPLATHLKDVTPLSGRKFR